MAMKEVLRGLLPAGVAALALAALVGAAPTRPLPHKPAYPPGPLKDVPFPSRPEEFAFQRIRQGNHWNISYRFHRELKDYQISCSIGVDAMQGLVHRFSYRNQDKMSAMVKKIQDLIKVKAPQVGSYGTPAFFAKFDETKGVLIELKWEPKYKEVLSGLDQQVANEEEAKFRDWYHSNKASLFVEAERSFMQQHRGFIEDPKQGWILDYVELVKQATPVLSGCIDAFSREVGKDPELLMSFFQAMPFAIIDDARTGLGSGGLRVPPYLLLQSEGDCDSKALTFCVLHRKLSHGLVIFRTFRIKGNRTPGHVLIGVELFASSAPKWGKEWPRIILEAGNYQDPIVVDNHYLVPCEVAGGHGKVPYSAVGMREDESGNPISKDDYVVIPIPMSP